MQLGLFGSPMDFTKLWDKRYLLGPNPLELSRSDWIFFWSAAAMIVLAAVSQLWALRQERGSPKSLLLRRLFHLFATTGVLILLMSGARYENIPWLSAHAVVLGLFLIWLVWLLAIVKYALGRFRRQQKLWEEERIKRKYLP